MKKTKITLATISIMAILPVLALATGMIPDVTPNGVVPVNNYTTLISEIENIAAAIFGLMAVIMFIVAGILFMTARGAPEKVQEARGAFMWGVVGVIVGIIAYSIVAIVGSFLRG